MAGLLVSVRSVEEARAAYLGGASVIDVKEPWFGPLGRASAPTWRAIRAATPAEVPVSVALGELAEFDPTSIRPADLVGIAFQKAGLAGSTNTWPDRWAEVCRQTTIKTGWVAVIYTDWVEAHAPHPDQVLGSALVADQCSGVLVDTWNKQQPCSLVANGTWRDRVIRVQESGRFVALAGRLDRAAIERLSPLRPDLFAVRGAACAGADRQTGSIDADLVAGLVATARTLSSKPELAR